MAKKNQPVEVYPDPDGKAASMALAANQPEPLSAGSGGPKSRPTASQKPDLSA